MLNSIALYFKSCRLLVKGQMQYRLSFLLQMLTQLGMIVMELLSVTLLMERFPILGQWTKGEILFFFGMVITAFFLTEALFRGLSHFAPLIRKGELDSILIRPRNVLFQVLCSHVDPRRFGAILIGIFALILGSRAANIQWSFSRFILLLWSTLGSIALIAALFMVEATLLFFSVQNVEAVNVLTYGGRSTCQYPIDIYPRPLQLLFTVIAPFALTVHLPASYILGKTLWNAAPLWVWLSPLSGFASFAVMTFFFYRGLRHYRSTGS